MWKVFKDWPQTLKKYFSVLWIESDLTFFNFFKHFVLTTLVNKSIILVINIKIRFQEDILILDYTIFSFQYLDALNTTHKVWCSGQVKCHHLNTRIVRYSNGWFVSLKSNGPVFNWSISLASNCGLKLVRFSNCLK